MDRPNAPDRPRPGLVVDTASLVAILGAWSAGSGPLFRQLADAIAAAIDDGSIRPGSRLPPERELATALALSRSTVVAALDHLRAEGRLERRQGSGTWVPARPLPTLDERQLVLDRVARNPLVEGVLGGRTSVVELTAAVTRGSPAVIGAAQEAVATDLPAIIGGHGYTPFGLPQLRAAIAARYTERGLPTTAAQILVTSGAQQAIALLTHTFVGPGSPVIVEDPTYIVALDTFRAASADIVGVPIGPDGPDPALLRERLLAVRPAFAYLVPTNQNPTGATTPDGARRAIARAAVDTGIAVVEDEATAFLEFGSGTTPRPIASHAPDGPILTIGSISKVAWGGLRVGWIRGPERTIARLGRVKVLADYGTPALSQAIGARVVERLPEIAAERQREIGAAADLLDALLAEHLPDWTWERPTGGITAWLRLPAGDAEALAQVALRHGVAIVPGSMLSISGGHGDRIRLAFGDPTLLPEGIARLGAAWRAYRRSADERAPDRLAWVV